MFFPFQCVFPSVPSWVYSHLMPSVIGIGSGATTILTRRQDKVNTGMLTVLYYIIYSLVMSSPGSHVWVGQSGCTVSMSMSISTQICNMIFEL